MSRRRRRRNNNRRNVQVPAAQSAQITNRNALRSITIKHREYVQQLTVDSGGGPNQVTKIIIQPGIEESFPWLSAVARRFESYRFTQLSYEYIPDVGSTTDGSIALCPDYDPGDDNTHASKATLLSFEDSVRGPLWAPLRMVCNPRNLKKRTSWYTRGIHLNADAKLMDTGNLWVSLNYDGDLVTMGEIWVTYTVVLITPQLENEPTERALFSQDYRQDQAHTPFIPLYQDYNRLTDVIDIVNANTLSLTQPGLYDFSYFVEPLGEAGKYFDPLWMTEVIPSQDVGQSGVETKIHTVASRNGAADQTDSEHLSAWILADNTTTKDNPVHLNWVGLAADTFIDSVLKKRMQITRVEEDVKNIMLSIRTSQRFVPAVPHHEARERVEEGLAIYQARLLRRQRGFPENHT